MTEETELSQRARNLFSELMDRSELQLDLAYTALLFNDRDLAEDVMELHQKLENVYIDFEETTLKLAKVVQTPEKLWSLVRTGDHVKDIIDAASTISDVVLRGLPTHPVIRSIFDSSSETVRRVKIEPGSQLDGKTLGEVKLQELSGMRVICIKRGEEWVCGPTSATAIKGGDILYVRGPSEGEQIIRNLAISSI
ncbi:MAG: TrkA C-terminal domain-containing protein [Candidatus Bathyarchaeia archaeon]